MRTRKWILGFSVLLATGFMLGALALVKENVWAATGSVVVGGTTVQDINGDPCYRECVKTLKSQGVEKDRREGYCTVLVIDMLDGECGGVPINCTEQIAKFNSCYGGVVPSSTCNQCPPNER